MSRFISVLWSYIKRHFAIILAVVFGYSIFAVIFYLYRLPLEAVLYAALLTTIAFGFIGILRFISYYNRHRKLEEIKSKIVFSMPDFPEPISRIEKDYQELIQLLNKSKMDMIYEKDNLMSNMVEYYKLWAHQIKTPISAMRIILQTQNISVNDELQEQLFKIEQYVEMVLHYIRTESYVSDLIIKRYNLDYIIKQALKKYSKQFIRKKIKLIYNDLNCVVLTDEKWLVFVIEQILSNSLKYTKQGSISIYMDDTLPKTLVIEDTGIGIEAEDLPRVFENGFTGFNGRADKKSTGIGLYLCKKILNKLSHTISVESHIGEGTKIKIGLNSNDIRLE